MPDAEKFILDNISGQFMKPLTNFSIKSKSVYKKKEEVLEVLNPHKNLVWILSNLKILTSWNGDQISVTPMKIDLTNKEYNGFKTGRAWNSLSSWK